MARINPCPSLKQSRSFTLKFIQNASYAALTTAMTPEVSQTAARILIADDDNALRHAIAKILKGCGYEVTSFDNGAEALEVLQRDKFDLAILDIWMPRMSGLEVLSHLRNEQSKVRIIIMTSDDTPETLLGAVREQAYDYIAKPFPPQSIIERAQRALHKDAEPPIEVLCAQPHWLELLAPCTRDTAERIEGFILQLEAGLDEDMRAEVASAFRELLMNAVEWGGKLDPNRKVRIAYVRTPRMLMYRIADPGQGFSFEKLDHAAVGQTSGDAVAHMAVREKKGIRPGGFGILMTKAAADELIYNDKQNEVIFIRYLTPHRAAASGEQ
jgi:CheY-like chemotaxis protein/anti-sigma regulatory factor (Ser/Thr protein kinase)